jgi:hypothetical protein
MIMVNPLKLFVAKINRKLGGGMEQRECMRFVYNCPVAVQDCLTGKQSAGRLANYNRLGLYFESEDAHDPGAEIDIRFDASVYLTTSDPLKAEVKWCRTIADTPPRYRYGIGVRYRPR